MVWPGDSGDLRGRSLWSEPGARKRIPPTPPPGFEGDKATPFHNQGKKKLFCWPCLSIPCWKSPSSSGPVLGGRDPRAGSSLPTASPIPSPLPHPPHRAAARALPWPHDGTRCQKFMFQKPTSRIPRRARGSGRCRRCWCRSLLSLHPSGEAQELLFRASGSVFWELWDVVPVVPKGGAEGGNDVRESETSIWGS